MHLYVEGGGDSKLLKTLCREGFREFLSKAGLHTHMPRIVACGGRQQAYDDFCTALKEGKDTAMLLVDSEDAVPAAAEAPWAHLLHRDNWEKPSQATDDHCHLVVQCMESWFLADRGALVRFFGQGFAINALPAEANKVEEISKTTVYKALLKATSKCKTKAPYSKGDHSFKLLALIDPEKVATASPWAKRFIHAVKSAMDC